jgi:hypothetical protein
LVSRHPEKHKYWLQWLKIHWDEVAGAKMSENSWPIRIDRKTLIVGVGSSVWNQALFIHKKELIMHIERNTREIIVEEIKCRVLEKPVPWPIPKEQSQETKIETFLDESHEKQIREEAKIQCCHVKDDQLRELLQKITIDFLTFQRKKQGGIYVPDRKP